MINPELEDSVHIDKLVELLTIFIEVAIDMRIEIEMNSLNDQDVINYLKLVEGQDRGELVAKLLDYESL